MFLDFFFVIVDQLILGQIVYFIEDRFSSVVYKRFYFISKLYPNEKGIAMLRLSTLTQMRRSEKVQIFSFEFTLPNLNRALALFNQDTCSMQKAPLMSIQISAFNKVNDWASLNSKTKCCGIVFIRLCIVRYSSQAIFFSFS